PAQPQSRALKKKKKKKKKSPSPPPPLSCLCEDIPLPPAPPAPAPLPRKPSGFARISPPPPRAVLQYRGKADHGEPGQQLPAAPGDGRLPLLEAVRRLRGQDRGPLSALCHGQLLGDIGTSCYTKSGMILCRNDYIRLFGNSGACSACGQSIPASELVMRAQGNVYHLKCFTCSTCRNRLVPGDRFHYINGSLFCEHDRPTALINGHLNSLQSNPLLPDQKVC
uniref:LIM domain only 4 n=3 Tax=Sus scrofa TaxID=9823 RepID=A0A8D0VG44_PIG